MCIKEDGVLLFILVLNIENGRRNRMTLRSQEQDGGKKWRLPREVDALITKQESGLSSR